MSCAGQCTGCALKSGSAANIEIENHLTGAITAMAGNPFYCHETLNWEVPADHALVVRNHPAVMRSNLLAITLPGQKPRVCAGWKSAVSELAKRGWFRDEAAPVRRRIAKQALRALITARSNPSGGKRPTRLRKRALADFEDYFKILAEDLKILRIAPEVIGL